MRDVLFGLTTPFLAGFVLWRLFFRDIAHRWVTTSRRPSLAAAAAVADVVCLSLLTTALMVNRHGRFFGPVVVFMLACAILGAGLALAAGIGKAPGADKTGG